MLRPRAAGGLTRRLLSRRALASSSAAAAAAPPRRDWRGGGGGGGERPFTPRSPLAPPPRPRGAADDAGAALLAASARRLGAPTALLAEGKARLFWDGNPVVFAGAVASLLPPSPPPAAGAPVLVADHRGTVFAWGVWNGDSLYRVRLLASASECASHPRLADMDVIALVEHRLKAATAMRAALGLRPPWRPGLATVGGVDGAAPPPPAPPAATSAYRLVNSEGDGLPGLCVDAFGPALVVSCSAAWAELRRDDLATALLRHWTEGGGGGGGATDGAGGGEAVVVWRPAVELLRREGLLGPGAVRPAAALTAAGWSAGEGEGGAGVEGAEEAADGADGDGDGDGDGGWDGDGNGDVAAAAPAAATVECTEHGVRFCVSLGPGQKTGHYCDQRANRRRVAELCVAAAAAARPPPPDGAAAAGATLLDLCCYSGGFSVAACAAAAAASSGPGGGGGRVAATGVDTSAAALASARRNAAANAVASDCHFVRSDALPFCERAAAAGQSWDVVVLDPPKLAPSLASLPAAARRYFRLTAAAAACVRPGGVLLVCSCSGAVARDGGFPALAAAAAQAGAGPGRRVALLAVAGAAPCHPRLAAHPEGAYLTAVYLSIS